MDQSVITLKEEYLVPYLEFFVDLYKNILLEESKNNFIFCPFGILAALTMTGMGAQSTTLVQFEKILRLSSLNLNSSIHPLLLSLQQHLMKSNISLASAVFIQNNYPIVSEFQTAIESFYKTKFFSSDFARDLDKQANEINAWIGRETKNKIQNMVDPRNLNEEMRLILLSAVYMKGEWSTKFPAGNTKDEKFHLLNGETVTVPMMSQTNHFLYGFNKDFGCTIIDIPYGGNELSMIILLPDTIDGLPKLENIISATVLKETKNSLKRMKIHLKLPRFQMEKTFSLKGPLSRMGLTEAFDGKNADFSGISNKNDLFISSVEQKTTLEVDEEGSVAASATMVRMVNKRSVQYVMDFVADHPFLFYIQDNLSGFPLFAGRFVAPKDQTEHLKEEL